MLTENDQKKSASYAIEMMLKLSNCFEQMSTICRTAVIDFTKDLHLKQDFERMAKYRFVAQQPKREVVSHPMVSQKIEEQMNIFQEISHQKSIVENKTRSTAPKRPIQLQSITVPPVQKQKKKQLPPVAQVVAPKKQNVQKRSKPKDPILMQKIQPVEGKRVIRQSRKISPKMNIQQNSDLSSQPSDYKSRNRRRTSKGRSRSKKLGHKSRNKKVTDPSIKRPLNGYINFFMEIKDELKQKYNVSKVPQISHLASLQWKKLTPKEQEKYNKIYYENVEKMKAEQKGEAIKIQLEEKNEPQSNKKDTRTYLKVKRPQKQGKTEKSEESSSSSSSLSSGSESSDSNDENSQSSSPLQSSQVKKKSKKGVIMGEKETKEVKDLKAQIAKQ